MNNLDRVGGQLQRLLQHVVALLLALSCGARRSEKPKDLALAPRPAAPGGSMQPSLDSVNCVALWPKLVRLRGTLSREIHLGPPGYGETPTRDRKDSIVVLTIPSAVRICGDSGTTGSSASVATDRFQVTGHAREALDHEGEQVTVYGSLTPAVWGWHYLKIILEADSIPDLHMTSRRRTTTMSSI